MFIIDLYVFDFCVYSCGGMRVLKIVCVDYKVVLVSVVVKVMGAGAKKRV